MVLVEVGWFFFKLPGLKCEGSFPGTLVTEFSVHIVVSLVLGLLGMFPVISLSAHPNPKAEAFQVKLDRGDAV